jgi:hypothetical protein
MDFENWYKRKINQWHIVLSAFINAIKDNRRHRIFYLIFISLIGVSMILDFVNLDEYDYFGLLGITGLVLYSGNLFRISIPSGPEYWYHRFASYALIVIGLLQFAFLILSIMPFFYMIPWRLWSFATGK